MDERVALLQRKLQALATRRLRRARGLQSRSARTSATTMSLSLSYTVPDAGWRPVYDARLALPKDAGRPRRSSSW
jgi:hypothetical protein